MTVKHQYSEYHDSGLHVHISQLSDHTLNLSQPFHPEGQKRNVGCLSLFVRLQVYSYGYHFGRQLSKGCAC